MLRKVERESGVEMVRVLRAKGDNLDAVEGAVSDAASFSTALRCLHEGVGKIDPGVRADARADELEEDAVAACEVGHHLVAGQLKERQQAPNSLNRVGIVLVRVGLAVDRPQLVFGTLDRRAPGRHVCW